MKAKEVLELLQITLPNGRYDYNKDSVYKIFNKGVDRKTYLYARVSTPKQKTDLENQINLLKQFSFSNGYQINKVFQDIASGISFEKRKDFFKMLDDIIDGKVERVIITYKDRLSRVGFDLFYYLFKKYHCEIIVMSEVGSAKLDSQEIFEEIVSLLHCYSMKLYSKRKGQKIKEVLKGDE
ncbi:IS607 family transposase [Clostridium sp. MT-14]|uniref:IS607 family transposase n=1 Tax=Clostridium sp. MT-14 TaxID=3348360 RepID=UPI0035F43216